MKDQIVRIFTFNLCLISILTSLLVTFVMFGINFNAMALPYPVFLVVMLLFLFTGVVSEIGFILRTIYSWKSLSKLQKIDNSFFAIALAFILSLLVFLSLGMILPGLNYHR